MSASFPSAQPRTFAVSPSRVLRNTYLLLTLSLLPTFVGAYFGVGLNFSVLAEHPILGTVGMVMLMLGFLAAINATRNSGYGVILLLGFTGTLGLLLGPLLQLALGASNGAELIALAAAGTSTIFLVMAGIAVTARRDFSFLGKFLLVGLVLLILASLANTYFQVPALTLTLAAVSVLLFSMFVLHDVSRIVTGGETNYVMAALAVYLDLYNLFTGLLRLLIGFAAED
jgi:modulator of FtsH protease